MQRKSFYHIGVRLLLVYTDILAYNKQQEGIVYLESSWYA